MIATELRGSTTTGASKVDAPETETVQNGDVAEVLTMSKACAFGNLERVKELVAESTSIDFVNQPDDDGYYPLQWAALNNRAELLEYLLENNARVENKDSKTEQTALHWAAVTGAMSALHILVKAGADPLARDCKGYTVPHIAAQYGQTQFLYTLATKYHVAIDQEDVDGRSPLHWAAYKGNDDCCKLLLVLDAKVNRTDTEQCTPLHWAAIRGYPSCITTLVHGGGGDALSMPEINGQRPEDLAQEKGHLMVAQHLKGLKAHIMKRKHPVWGKHGQMAWLSKLDMSWFIWSQFTVMNMILWFLVRNSVSLPPPSAGITRLCQVTLLVSVVGMVLLYKTTFTDPGYVPVHLGDLTAINRDGEVDTESAEGKRKAQYTVVASPALEKGAWGQLCVSCRLVRPLRAKHCAVNDRCVEVFDHYCPWVGNTVAKGNRHYFMYLLFAVAGALFLAALTGIMRLREGKGGLRTLAGGFWIVLFVTWMCVLLISTMAILLAQVQSISGNITTNEMSNWHRYPYMKHPRSGMFRNPFDKGWKANWAQAMFPWRQPMEGVTVEMSPGAKQLSEAETRGTSVGTGMIDFNALRSGRGGDSEESPLLKGRGSEHVHGPNCRHHH